MDEHGNPIIKTVSGAEAESWGYKPGMKVKSIVNTDWKPAEGSISRSDDYAYSMRNEYDQGFLPGMQNQEDNRSKNQSGLDLFGKALGRFATTTITKAGAGLSDAGGVIASIVPNTANWLTGNGFWGHGWDSTNNVVSQGFRAAEESIKENLPIYHSDQEKNGSFGDKLKSGAWWSDQAMDGASFMASAWIGGGLVSKGFGLIGKIGGLASKFSTAENAIGEAATIMTGGQKKVNALVKAAQSVGIDKGLGQSATRWGVTGINTLSESMAEGYDTYNQLKNELTAKKILGLQGNSSYALYASLSDDKIEQAAHEAYQGTLSKNMGVLLFPNWIESGWILGKGAKTAAASRGGLFAALEDAGSEAEGLAKYLGKTSPWKNALKEGGKGILLEGYWEENIQGAIQKYEQAIGNPILSDKEKTLIPHYMETYKNNIWNGTAAMFGFKNDKDSKEAAESIFLGSLMGGLGGSVGSVLHHKEEQSQKQEIVDGFWKTFKQTEALSKAGFIRELAAPLNSDKRKVQVKTGQKKKDLAGNETTEDEVKDVEIESIMNPDGSYKWNHEKLAQDIRESFFNDRTIDHAILADATANPHYQALHAHYSLFNLAGQIERAGYLGEEDKEQMSKRIIDQFNSDIKGDTETNGNNNATIFNDDVITLERLNAYRKIQQQSTNNALGDQQSIFVELGKESNPVKEKNFKAFVGIVKQNLAVEQFRLNMLENMRSRMTSDSARSELDRMIEEKQKSAESFNFSKKSDFLMEKFNEYHNEISISGEQEKIKENTVKIAELDIKVITSIDTAEIKELNEQKAVIRKSNARLSRKIDEKRQSRGYSAVDDFYAADEIVSNKRQSFTTSEFDKSSRFRNRTVTQQIIDNVITSTVEVAKIQDIINDPNPNKIFEYLTEKATNRVAVEGITFVQALNKELAVIVSAAYYDGSLIKKLHDRAKNLATEVAENKVYLIQAAKAILGFNVQTQDGMKQEDVLNQDIDTETTTDSLINTVFKRFNEDNENGIDLNDAIDLDPHTNLIYNIGEFAYKDSDARILLDVFLHDRVFDEHAAALNYLKDITELWRDYLEEQNDYINSDPSDYRAGEDIDEGEARIATEEAFKADAKDSLDYEDRVLPDGTTRKGEITKVDELLAQIEQLKTLPKLITDNQQLFDIADFVDRNISRSEKDNKRFGVISKASKTNTGSIVTDTNLSLLDKDKLAQELVKDAMLRTNGVHALDIATQLFEADDLWNNDKTKILPGKSIVQDVESALEKLRAFLDSSEEGVDESTYRLDDSVTIAKAIEVLKIVAEYMNSNERNTIGIVNDIETQRKKAHNKVAVDLGLGNLVSSYDLFPELEAIKNKKAAKSIADSKSFLKSKKNSFRANILSSVSALFPKDQSDLVQRIVNEGTPVAIINNMFTHATSSVWKYKAKVMGSTPLQGDAMVNVNSIMTNNNFIRVWTRTMSTKETIKSIKADTDFNTVEGEKLRDNIIAVLSQIDDLQAYERALDYLESDIAFDKLDKLVKNIPTLITSSGVYPNYQQINAFIEGVIHIEKGAKALGTSDITKKPEINYKENYFFGLMGQSGAGKTMMSRFIYDYYVSRYGSEGVYFIGHTSASTANLAEAIDKNLSKSNILSNEQFYQILMDNTDTGKTKRKAIRFVIGDEQLALPNKEIKFIFDQMKRTNGMFLFIGDAAQPRGETQAYLSNFDRSNHLEGLHRIDIMQPLSIGYRTYIPSIELAAMTYKDKTIAVQPKNVYASHSTEALLNSNENIDGVIMDQGKDSDTIIKAVTNRKNNNRSKVIIVSNQAMARTYDSIKGFPELEILTFSEVQGHSFDEAYVAINPTEQVDIRDFDANTGKVHYISKALSDIRADFYNSIMYMTTTRARRFTYIHNYSSIPVENHVKDLGDQVLLSKEERDNNEKNYKEMLTSWSGINDRYGHIVASSPDTTRATEIILTPPAAIAPKAPVTSIAAVVPAPEIIPTETVVVQTVEADLDEIFTENNNEVPMPDGAAEVMEMLAKAPIDPMQASLGTELSYPSRIDNTVVNGRNIRYSASEIRDDNDSWVNTEEAVIVPITKKNTITKRNETFLGIMAPVKYGLTLDSGNRFWIPLAVLSPEEQTRSENSAANLATMKSMGGLNKVKFDMTNGFISNDAIQIARDNGLDSEVTVHHMNDLSIRVDFNTSFKDNFDQSETRPYDTWLDHYVVNYIDSLINKGVGSTNRDSIEDFLNPLNKDSLLITTPEGRNKINPKHFVNAANRAVIDNSFGIIFDIASTFLFKGYNASGILGENNELKYLLTHKSIKGSPILIFKNIPVSKDTKKDFFAIMQSPRLSREHSTIKALSTYKANVEAIAAPLINIGIINNANDLYNTNLFNVLAYAGKELFSLDLENDNVKRRGFDYSILVNALNYSLERAKIAIADKYRSDLFGSLKSKKDGFIRLNTKDSIAEILAELDSQVELLKNSLDSIASGDPTNSTISDFFKSLQDIVFGTQGSLFTLEEKNKPYSNTEIAQHLGIEEKDLNTELWKYYDLKTNRIVISEHDDIDGSGTTISFISKALNGADWRAAQDEGSGITEFTDEQLLNLSFIRRTFLRAKPKEPVTDKIKDLQVTKKSPVMNALHDFSIANTDLISTDPITGETIRTNIAGFRYLNLKGESKNADSISIISPLDAMPNYEYVKINVRKALLEVVKYQVASQFDFSTGEALQDKNKGHILFNSREEARAFILANPEEKMLDKDEQKAVYRQLWESYPETKIGFDDLLSDMGPKAGVGSQNKDIVEAFNQQFDKRPKPFDGNAISNIEANPENYKSAVRIHTPNIDNLEQVSVRAVQNDMANGQVDRGLSRISQLQAPEVAMTPNSIKVSFGNQTTQVKSVPAITATEVKEEIIDNAKTDNSSDHSPAIIDNVADVTAPAITIDENRVTPMSIRALFTTFEALESLDANSLRNKLWTLLTKDNEDHGYDPGLMDVIVNRIILNEPLSIDEQLSIDGQSESNANLVVSELYTKLIEDKKTNPKKTFLKKGKNIKVAFYDERKAMETNNAYSESAMAIKEGEAYVAKVLNSFDLPKSAVAIIFNLAEQGISNPELGSHVKAGAINLKLGSNETFHKDIFHHEFLHLILRYGMTERQRRKVFIAAKRHYEETSPTSFEILSRYDQEEYIANTFEDWMKGKDLETEPKGIFQKLLYAIKRVLDVFMSPKLDTYFKRIQSGVYRRYQTKFDKIYAGTPLEVANYTTSPLFKAGLSSKQLLETINTVRSEINTLLHNGVNLIQGKPDTNISLSLHQVQAAVWEKLIDPAYVDNAIVKKIFQKKEASDIYKAVIESFSKGSSELSRIRDERTFDESGNFDPNGNGQSLANIKDETLDSYNVDVLDSSTHRFYELSLLFTNSNNGKIERLDRKKVIEVAVIMNERIPLSDLSLVSEMLKTNPYSVGTAEYIFANKLISWVNQTKISLEYNKAFGHIFYHYSEKDKGYSVIHSMNADNVITALEDLKSGKSDVHEIKIKDKSAPISIYQDIQAFLARRDIDISATNFSAIFNKALATNYLNTLSFTVGSLKLNNFTEDREDTDSRGNTMFRRSNLDSNDAFHEITINLPTIFAIEYKDILEVRKTEKITDIEAKVRMIKAFVSSAESSIDEKYYALAGQDDLKITADTSAIKTSLDIVLNKLGDLSHKDYFTSTETDPTLLRDEDGTDFLESILSEMQEDPIVAKAFKAIAHEFQRVDKATMNHSLISSTGERIYKFTQSSFMDDLLRSLISSTTETESKKVNSWLSEKWLQHNHLVNKSILGGTVKLVSQTTHDGFRHVFLGTSKPTERENTMEYYRRLTTFAYMDVLLNSVKPGTKQVQYDQETYQLAHRSRAQSVRMTFLDKEQSKKAIINIFKTIRERPSEEIDNFFAVKNGLMKKNENSDKLETKEAYLNKLFMNMSLSVSDSGMVEKDGKQVIDYGNTLLIENKDAIINGNEEALAEVADKIISELNDNVTQKVVDEMLLYEMPFHQRLPEVIDVLISLGYMTTDEKKLLEIFMNPEDKNASGQPILKKKQAVMTKKADDSIFDTGRKAYWYDTLDETSKETARSILAKVLAPYTINRYANMYHLNNLISGDMQMYANPVDLIKRLLGTSASGHKLMIDDDIFTKRYTNALIVSDPLLSTYDLTEERKQEAVKKRFSGIEAFKDKTYEEILDILNDREKVFSDSLTAFKEAGQLESSEVNDRNTKEIETALSLNAADRNFLRTGYESSIQAFITRILANTYTGQALDDKVSTILKAFGKKAIETTDGQGLMTYKGYLNLKKGVDDAFGLAGIIKSVYFGISDHAEIFDEAGNKIEKSTPFYAKNSYLVLSPEFLARHPEMKEINDFLEIGGHEELLFSSSIKVGAPRNIVSMEDMIAFREMQNQLLEENTNDEVYERIQELKNKISTSTIKLNNRNRRIQFNPQSDLEGKVSMPTQMLYMIGTMTPDNSRVRQAYTALSYLFEKEIYNVLENKIKGANFPSFVQRTIESSPEAYMYYDMLVNADNIEYHSLNDPWLKKKFISSVMTKMTKDAINLKFRGAKMILASSAILSNKGYNADRANTKADKLTYRHERVLINGQWKDQIVADVIVPEGLFNETPEMLAQIKEKGFFFKSGDLLSLRIPTTGKHSGVVFRVVDTHKSEENIIFMPPEVAAIHGSDFDVDSLFTIQRGIYKGPDISVIRTIRDRQVKLAYKENQFVGYKKQEVEIAFDSEYHKVEDAYQSTIGEAMILDDVEVEQELADIKAMIDQLQSELLVAKDRQARKALNQQIKGFRSIEDVILKNIIVEQIMETLISKDHWDEMLLPITMEFVEDIVESLKKAGYQKEMTQAYNLSLMQDAAKMHYNVFAGLNLVGASANSFKTYSYIFRAGLSVEDQQAVSALYQEAKKIVHLNSLSDKIAEKTTDEQTTEQIKNISDQSVINYIQANLSNPGIKAIANKIAEIANKSVNTQIPHTGETSTIEQYPKTPMSRLINHNLGNLGSFFMYNTNYNSLSEFAYKIVNGKIQVFASSWMTLDSFINLAVDNVKEGKLAQLKLDFDTINPAVAMVMMGIPFDKDHNFNYQPSISMLKYGKYASIDKLDKKVGMISISKRPAIDFNKINKVNSNGELGIGEILFKILFHLKPSLFTKEDLYQETVDLYDNTTGVLTKEGSKKYYFLDNVLSEDKVSLNEDSMNRNKTKEANQKMQNLFSKIMRMNNISDVSEESMLTMYYGSDRSNPDRNIDQLVLDIQHNLKVLVYFKELDRIGNNMTKIKNILGTLQMNPNDVVGIDDLLQDAKIVGNIPLGLTYVPTDSYASFKAKVNENKYFVQNSDFSFDITNFFNTNPQIKSSLSLLAVANDFFKDEQYFPWLSQHSRDFVDNAFKKTTGDKDAQGIFKYRIKGMPSDNGSKYLMLDELQRFSLQYYWKDLIADSDAPNIDVNNTISYTKDAIAIARTMGLKSNSIIKKLRMDSDYLRFDRNRNLSPEESFALYKEGVDELTDYIYVITPASNISDIGLFKPMSTRIVKVEGFEPSKGEQFVSMDMLIALASKFSKTKSSEAEDTVFRLFNHETKDTINRLSADSYELFKAHTVNLSEQVATITRGIKESGGDIESVRTSDSYKVLRSIQEAYVTSFFRRNVKFIDEMRTRIDESIVLFDTGNEMNKKPNGKSKPDYSGIEDNKEILDALGLMSNERFQFDLKVTSAAEDLLPLYSKNRKGFGKSDTSDLLYRFKILKVDDKYIGYYVSLGNSNAFSVTSPLNWIRNPLRGTSFETIGHLQVLPVTKKTEQSIFFNSFRDLEKRMKNSIGDGSSVYLFERSDPGFVHPILLSVTGVGREEVPDNAKGKDKYNLPKSVYTVDIIDKKILETLPEGVQMNTKILSETVKKIVNDETTQTCALPNR